MKKQNVYKHTHTLTNCLAKTWDCTENSSPTTLGLLFENRTKMTPSIMGLDPIWPKHTNTEICQIWSFLPLNNWLTILVCKQNKTCLGPGDTKEKIGILIHERQTRNKNYGSTSVHTLSFRHKKWHINQINVPNVIQAFALLHQNPIM